jgi:hypothetical protein
MSFVTESSSIVVARKGIARPAALIAALERTRLSAGADIAVCGRLWQYWSDGTKKRLITFEHERGALSPQAAAPPEEAAPFLKERWNPFYGLAVVDAAIVTLPKDEHDPSAWLEHALKRGYSVFLAADLTAEEHLSINWRKFSLRELAQKHRRFRNIALALHILFGNLLSLAREGKKYRAYRREIAAILNEQKELVLELEFGGIGDCLAFSTLPRKLYETYGVSFYLSERSRFVFRSPDFAKLCFEMNPYFKGYKSGPAFRPLAFVREGSLRQILFDRGGDTAVANIERQFGLEVGGVPEIFYSPRRLPGYEKVLLCDKNWFSGEKWGLYYDETSLETGIKQWQECGNDRTVEYVDTKKQTLFEYLDKIHSCGKFVCVYSGGNSLAAALRKSDAVVLVPENFEGAALSLFLFRRSHIRYVRKKSLAAYY